MRLAGFVARRMVETSGEVIVKRPDGTGKSQERSPSVVLVAVHLCSPPSRAGNDLIVDLTDVVRCATS